MVSTQQNSDVAVT